MAAMFTASPRSARTRCFVVLFVVIAGVFGGPVAGSLETDGGFTANDSGSARAERPHRGGDRHAGRAGGGRADDARPTSADAGRAPQLAGAAGHRVAVASTTRARSRDGSSGLPAATLAADARRGRRRRRPRRALRGTGDVLLGGSLFAQHQIGDAGRRDLGRAEMLAFPILLLLSLLFFRGRAAVLPLVVGHDHRARHLPRADGGQPGLLALDLRAQPRDRPRARPGDRLHAVPRHPLPRGARRKGNPDAGPARR